MRSKKPFHTASSSDGPTSLAINHHAGKGQGAAFVSLGAVLGVLLMGAWLGLTAWTGLNYHLFPLIIAGTPATIARFFLDRPLLAKHAAFASLIGIVLVVLGWLVLVATDQDPSATFVNGQPGGVVGEAAITTAIGAIAGGWWAVKGASE